MNRITIIFIILFFSQFGFSQLVSIDFKTKAISSNLILEGEIVSKTPFLSKDGYIYTRNTLSINKLLKGNLQGKNKVNIITRGGLLNGDLETWSHLLSLEVGDYGVFFLVNNGSETFRTFSSAQGFLKFSNDETLHANDILNSYRSIQSDIYDPIEKISNEKIRIISSDKKRTENCLSLNIVPIIPDINRSNELRLSLTASITEVPVYLQNFDIDIEYDTTQLGKEVISNAIIQIYAGNEVDLSRYNVSSVDIQNNKIRISIASNLGNNSFLLLDELQKEILQVTLELPDNTGFPDLNVNTEQIGQSSTFIDVESLATVNLNCVLTNFESIPRACPEITSFTPLSAAAGVGMLSENEIPGVITIHGHNFTNLDTNEKYRPDDHWVGFTNVNFTNGGEWMYPPKRDIISWNDTLIKVRVPSLDQNGGQGAYAGTGKIIVIHTSTCYDTSDVDLYVPFCVRNSALRYPSDDSFKSIKTKMSNFNSDGGYDIWFEDSFLEIDSAGLAFQRALHTWQCQTHVNFQVKSVDNISNFVNDCSISVDTTLPVGVTSLTLAHTSVGPKECVNDKSHSYLPFFKIIFNKYLKYAPKDSTEIIWHTATIPLNDSLDLLGHYADLETVALHELGHASLLRHTNNNPNVMYKGQLPTRKSLTSDDFNGGEHAVLLSIRDPNCSGIMIPFDCIIDATSDFGGNFREPQLFPNPVSNNLYLEFHSMINGDIFIYDTFGQKVFHTEFEGKTKIIDVRNLNKGIFFLKFTEEKSNKNITIKFIKL